MRPPDVYLSNTFVPCMYRQMFGGYLLQEGGTLAVTNSHFYVMRPGVLFREVYTVGGQILVLGGSGACVS